MRVIAKKKLDAIGSHGSVFYMYNRTTGIVRWKWRMYNATGRIATFFFQQNKLF